MLGNAPPIQKIRERIIPLAQGTILEIGVGPGVNVPHYDRTKVDKIFALEPNPGMVRRTEKQRLQTKLDVEFLDLPGERIPLPGGSVDIIPWSARSRCARFPVWWGRFKVSDGSSSRVASSFSS